MLAAIHFSNLYHQFWPSTIDGITTGAIYALVALGYTLVYGVLRLINFAHSEVFMIGTVGVLVGVNVVGLAANDPVRTGLPFVGTLLVCLIFAMAFSGGAAVLLERIAYRPLRKRGASRLAALISAIGASLFLQELFAQPRLLGRNDHFVHNLVKPSKIIVLPQGAIISVDKVVVFAGAIVMMVGLLFMVKIQQTRYDVGFILGIKAFTAAVLGGIGNLRGALVGGFVLGLIEIYGATIFGAQWLNVVAFVVLVVVLMFRPTGILGEAITKARA